MKRKLQLFIMFHALAAFAAMWYTSTQTQLSLNALIIHPLLVCAGYTTLLLILPTRAAIVAISAFTLFLGSLYLSNIVAIQYWNELISWSFLQINAEVIVNELAKFPLVLAPIVIVLVVAIVLAYRYFLATQTLRLNDFGVLLISPLLVAGFVLSTWHIAEDMDIIWQGEPFYEFLKPGSHGATLQQEIIVTPGGKASPANESPFPNIVMIHGDALRADRLGAYGNPRETSPFIDGLIENGAVKIPHSMSNCSESICGFSAVLTSGFSFHNSPTGLFEQLSEQGYVNTFLGTGSLYHAGLDKYLRPRVDNFLRADLDDNYYMHDDKYILDVLEEFPEFRDIPNLFYLRMMSSHGLGSHRQKYKKYQPTRNSLLAMLGGESQREALINEADNRARQFDAYVEMIFDSLKKKGYLDNAIVVIYGDHGDALGERGNYGHYQSLYQEEIGVPIIFWSSDNLRLDIKTDFFATLMDIPPTLLYQLELPIPESFLGSPLQQARRVKIGLLDDRKETAGLLYQDADRLLKLVFPKQDFTRAQLFDLRNDPGETQNLYARNTKLARMIFDRKDELLANPSPDQPAPGVDSVE